MESTLGPELRSTIEQMISENQLMVFMKGTSDMPRCRFSAQVVSILKELGHDFSAYDILMDPEMRQGLKEFTNWPTYPQVYFKGKFIGGCDVITEMADNGQLNELLSN